LPVLVLVFALSQPAAAEAERAGEAAATDPARPAAQNEETRGGLEEAEAAAAEAAAAAKDLRTPPRASSLEDLLQEIRDGGRAQREENTKREAEFRATRARQEELLARAEVAKAAEEERSATLERQFEENETRIPELQETLRGRMGALGELFGVVRQVAGDTQALVQQSLISAQLPGRGEILGRLGENQELPSVSDLEHLWFTLQQEMTESANVARFTAPVIAAQGGEAEATVSRVGPFIAVSNGRYLQFLPETGKLAELARQPASRHLASVEELEAATAGIVGVSIDPSRGSILSLLIQTPSFRERIRQGGIVGYVIICLGIVGVLLTGQRVVYLGVVGRRIQAQIASTEPRGDNPLGRIQSVYMQNAGADVESLELKLDEAILKEVPRLERGNAMIKVLSVVGPLLGLLGTVTGMIETFQAITLFGTGDPKLMASGISQALVTTVQGLVMAIPLTLLHSLVSGRSRGLVQLLQEQSAGIIAAHDEHLEASRHENQDPVPRVKRANGGVVRDATAR
jgi:biopolymer transport protein ExbB